MKYERVTSMQNELSTFYEQDVCRWIQVRQLAGMTYVQISIQIQQDTGWRVKPTTLQRWMSYWRNGR